MRRSSALASLDNGSLSYGHICFRGSVSCASDKPCSEVADGLCLGPSLLGDDTRTFHIGELELSGLSEFRLSRVRIRDAAGRDHMTLEQIGFVWSPLDLLAKKAQINRLELNGLEVDLVQDDDGTIGLLALFPSSETASSGASFFLGVGRNRATGQRGPLA